MCQAKPGPRCYADSSKRLKTLAARVETAEGKRDAAVSKMKDASRARDLVAFSKARREKERAEKALKPLRDELRHTQRDVDSTKTGRRELDDQILEASSKDELKTLENRKAAAELLYAWRENALQIKQEGYQPVIRIASPVAA